MFTSPESIRMQNRMIRNKLLLARQQIKKIESLKKEIEVCSALIIENSQKSLDIQKDYYQFLNLIEAACDAALVEQTNTILRKINVETLKLQERIGEAFRKMNEIQPLKGIGVLLAENKEEEEKISQVINRPQG